MLPVPLPPHSRNSGKGSTLVSTPFGSINSPVTREPPLLSPAHTQTAVLCVLERQEKEEREDRISTLFDRQAVSKGHVALEGFPDEAGEPRQLLRSNDNRRSSNSKNIHGTFDPLFF